jgi:PhoH-like ATPase
VQPPNATAAPPAPAANSGHEAAGSRAAPRPRRTRTGPTTLFVLDTNVLLHDPTSLFRFEEHDIFLPMVVLEELDNHKKGMTEVARNGRQVSRTLDALVAAQPADLGPAAECHGPAQRHRPAVLPDQPLDYRCPPACPRARPTTRSWAWSKPCASSMRREVVLVSKDINMRVKARALGLPPRTTRTTRCWKTATCCTPAPWPCPRLLGQGRQERGELAGRRHTYYRISGAIVPQLMINQFVYYEAPGEPSLYARVTEIRDKTAVLKTLKDYGHPRTPSGA